MILIDTFQSWSLYLCTDHSLPLFHLFFLCSFIHYRVTIISIYSPFNFVYFSHNSLSLSLSLSLSSSSSSSSYIPNSIKTTTKTRGLSRRFFSFIRFCSHHWLDCVCVCVCVCEVSQNTHHSHIHKHREKKI